MKWQPYAKILSDSSLQEITPLFFVSSRLPIVATTIVHVHVEAWQAQPHEHERIPWVCWLRSST